MNSLFHVAAYNWLRQRNIGRGKSIVPDNKSSFYNTRDDSRSRRIKRKKNKRRPVPKSEHELPPMAYVERGVVKSKRTIWRLKTITDFFWAIINFIGVFFTTMFSMEKSDAYRKGSGSSKKWDGGGPGGPGGPGSGPYGRGPRGPPRGLDNVRGIDHSSLPACGSCCGG